MTRSLMPLALAHRNPGPAPGFRVSGPSIRAPLALYRQVCPDILSLCDNRSGPDVELCIGSDGAVLPIGLSRSDSLRESASSYSHGDLRARAPRGESVRLAPSTALSSCLRLALVSRSDSPIMAASVSPILPNRIGLVRHGASRLDPSGLGLVLGRSHPGESDRLTHVHCGLPEDLNSGSNRSMIPVRVSRSDSRVRRPCRFHRAVSRTDSPPAPVAADRRGRRLAMT